MARVLLILSTPSIERTVDEMNLDPEEVKIPGYFDGELGGFLTDQQPMDYIETLETIDAALKAVQTSEPNTALQLTQAEEMVRRLCIDAWFNFENLEIARLLSLVKLPEHSKNVAALMTCILKGELDDSGTTDSFLPK